MVDTIHQAVLIHQEVVMLALGNKSHIRIVGPPQQVTGCIRPKAR